MKLRTMLEDDAAASRRVWNSAAIFDPVSQSLFKEKVWDDPDADRDLRIVCERDEGLVGFAVGVTRVKEQSRVGYIKMIAVLPAHQRSGVGSSMMHRLEEALVVRGATSIRPGESAPNYLTPGVDIRYTKATVFLEDRGYERIGQSYNMEVDLLSQSFDGSSQEQSLRADGFELRRATASDRPAVMSLLADHWPSWGDEVGAAFSNSPISLFVCANGGSVVAFSAHETNNRGTGWFGPMGTAPAARGKGIGSLLLKRSLRDLKESGFDRAVIPWVAPISFYLHHVGAEVRRVFVRYEKKTTP